MFEFIDRIFTEVSEVKYFEETSDLMKSQKVSEYMNVFNSLMICVINKLYNLRSLLWSMNG